MLDYNNYFIGKIENLKDFFTITYVIIDDIYNKLIPDRIKYRRNISDSKLSDTEIITIGLVGEAMTIDSEKAWFNFVKKNFKELFPQIGDRTRFNRTKRNLYKVISEIQTKFFSANKFGDNSYRIVDSMPIPVCNFGRAYFSKSFKDISSYGYCASKKESYFGLKLHALITTKGFITDFTLTSANVDDREALWELTESYKNIKIIGDKGYVSMELGKQLALEQNISLLALQRKNSKTQFPKHIRNILSKMRRRVETSFSQLTEQFNANKVLAKSKLGLMTRITIKILAHNISYLINFLSGNEDNIGKIKHLVFG